MRSLLYLTLKTCGGRWVKLIIGQMMNINNIIGRVNVKKNGDKQN